MAVKDKNQKRSFPTATVIGISVVLVGVLIIVISSCIPIWSAQGGLKDRIDEITTDELPFITVYDPKLGNDLMNQGGTEKPMAGTAADRIRTLFLAVAENMSFSESGSELSPNDFEYRLRFKTADGSTDFFIKEGRIYYVENGARHYFTPKDSTKLDELAAHLGEILKK